MHIIFPCHLNIDRAMLKFIQKSKDKLYSLPVSSLTAMDSAQPYNLRTALIEYLPVVLSILVSGRVQQVSRHNIRIAQNFDRGNFDILMLSS